MQNEAGARSTSECSNSEVSNTDNLDARSISSVVTRKSDNIGNEEDAGVAGKDSIYSR